MAYAAILFDLFDTLVNFDRDRLPVLEIDGRTVRSTAGHVHRVLCEQAPHVTVEACYAALMASWQEAERLRAIDHREVTAPQRFAHFLGTLDLPLAGMPAGFVDRLLETHRRQLAKAAHFPPHHAPLLAKLAARYRLAVVSNFDYTPTALEILDSAGVMDLFTTIVVSDAVGWRKPRREIFDEALRRVGVAAAEALFVGDRADIDVAGAHGVGMDVAWINPAREPLPPGVAAPHYEIRDLGELAGILRC
ncbi:MAG: HAD family hydrolase [Candidatus Rokuibacteriota bacterium]